MEAHESIFLCIVVFAFDLLVIHIVGYGVVDIQQSYGIVAYYSSDELAEGSVDINLAGYRDSLCGKTAVYIAGNEAELCLECRPAFACKGNELTVSSVLLNPVFQGQFILSQFGKDLRFLIACAKLFFHFLYKGRDSLVACVFVKCFKQVELRVLFDLHADIVELFDRRVAGKEV